MVGAGLVLVAVLAIVGFSMAQQGSPSARGGHGDGMEPAPPSVVDAVSRVPQTAFAAAGVAATRSGPYVKSVSKLKAQPRLSVDGKPLLDYAGSNWCPYCAATRWPLAVALARFGSFTGLKLTASGRGPDEDYPGTSTLSFYRVGYVSRYVSFVGTELCTDVVAKDTSSAAVMNCDGYEPLESLPGLEARLFYNYDFPPYQSSLDGGGIPFIDFGNKYVEQGAFVSPAELKNLTQLQISRSLRDPLASPGRAILVGANYYSAIICALTHGRPASVCATPVVRRAARSLKL